MPLLPGNDRATISRNIREMKASGRSQPVAVAAALSNADRHPRKADGGGLDAGPGGETPTTGGQDPFVQNMVERYRGMPAEQLQELSVRLGSSPQGQIVQRVLRQKRLNPDLPHMADGGVMSASEGSPWWTRMAAHEAFGSGLLHSAVAGRTDQLRVQAPSGSYVLPADVVAGLGEGNSLAGARILQEMFKTGPGGVPLSQARGRNTMPQAPSARVIQELQGDGGGTTTTRSQPGFAKGGAAGSVPILAAGGEFIIHPRDLMRLFGDLNRAHTVLDKWVVMERKKHIKEIKALPGPARD